MEFEKYLIMFVCLGNTEILNYQVVILFLRMKYSILE
jgi:hypothetical protein